MTAQILKFSDKDFSRNKIHKKTPVPELVFHKSYRPAYDLIEKETLTQLFFCNFCEILKNTFFIEQLWWLLLLL